MKSQRNLTFILALASCLSAMATVKPASLFQNGMVLQRGREIPVWGTADSGERVDVVFRGHTYTTTAGADGKWRIQLPKQKAGGPYTLNIAGTELTDVLIGDVWICSGQSNIDVNIERVYPIYSAEVDAANDNHIRLIRVINQTNTHETQTHTRTTAWQPLSKQDAWQFSAVGYFLGKEMKRRHGVPQGIIQTSWGGTPIEAWLSSETMRSRWPEQYEETQVWDDANMVEAWSRASAASSNRWEKMLAERDLGLKEDWTSSSYREGPEWQAVEQFQPNLADWAQPQADDATNQGLKRRLAECQDLASYGLQSTQLVSGRSFCGTLYLRQHIHIDAAHAGRPALLLLGTLYDQDYTYLNGKEVGRTYYQYPPRRYSIPAGLLKEGDNVLTIRFVNKSGIPHFIPEKPYMLVFEDTKDTVRLATTWLKRVGCTMPTQRGGGAALQNLPSTLYNAMLAPLAPYAISGVVWYQGESNTGRAQLYADQLAALEADWRKAFEQPELAFAIVQLANHMAPSLQPQETGWAQLREAQRTVAQFDAHSGLVVAIDCGENVDIHPLRKHLIAERAANCFDRLVFQKKNEQSPAPVSALRKGNEVVITFDAPLSPSARIHEVELASADRRFRNADARAEGQNLIVRLPEGMEKATFLRYAWKNNPLRANLYGRTSLPASPFEMPIP